MCCCCCPQKVRQTRCWVGRWDVVRKKKCYTLFALNNNWCKSVLEKKNSVPVWFIVCFIVCFMMSCSGWRHRVVQCQGEEPAGGNEDAGGGSAQPPAGYRLRHPADSCHGQIVSYPPSPIPTRPIENKKKTVSVLKVPYAVEFTLPFLVTISKLQTFALLLTWFSENQQCTDPK